MNTVRIDEKQLTRCQQVTANHTVHVLVPIAYKRSEFASTRGNNRERPCSLHAKLRSRDSKNACKMTVQDCIEQLQCVCCNIIVCVHARRAAKGCAQFVGGGGGGGTSANSNASDSIADESTMLGFTMGVSSESGYMVSGSTPFGAEPS